MGAAAALLLGLSLTSGGVVLSLADRVDAERAVERAHYRFLAAPKPH
jgi:hypothetical protein